MEMHLVEAFGRPVQPGDQVILPGVVSPVLRVVEVRPDLSPTAPRPQLVVTLAFQQTITLPANQPVRTMVLVMPAPETVEPSAPTEESPSGLKLVE